MVNSYSTCTNSPRRDPPGISVFAVGFAEGIGIGIAGLAAKPLVGLLDAATFTMEGVWGFAISRIGFYKTFVQRSAA